MKSKLEWVFLNAFSGLALFIESHMSAIVTMLGVITLALYNISRIWEVWRREQRAQKKFEEESHMNIEMQEAKLEELKKSKKLD